MSNTLPFLGTSRSAQADFKKTSSLGFRNGYALPQEGSTDNNADIDVEALRQATLKMTYGDRVGSRPKNEAKTVPKFVSYDKQVLFFKAYMKSTVHESPIENHRVRFFKVYYYLENDTMSITEPEVENSGIPQGPFLRKQILSSESGKQYKWTDLNIGMNIEVYSKVLRLYECNKSTQTFLESKGVVVPSAEAAPTDPYTLSRQAVDHPNFMHTTPSDFDKLKQFLVLDRKVLRFYCTWDDPSSSGAKLKAVMFYFLVDDALEIREIHDTNGGRDPFPVFLRRRKVPRNHREVPADFPTITLEKTEIEVSDFLNPADFATGQEISVYGRNYFLYACDDFTRDFYKQNFGLDLQDVDVSAPPTARPVQAIPPYNGLGSPEDSYLSCVSVNPKAPLGQKSLLQLLKYDNKLLRFEAEIDSMKEEHAGRKFIISYRLADDMVSIFEPHGSQSDGGFGGLYLSFQHLPRAGTDPDKPAYLKPEDFHVGARIEVYGTAFVVLATDDASKKYMLI
eukprot:m.46293 g.46293  ORF g.46293 m.46293 type:complete len:509 (+) comp20199_c1_seq1:172-1698(+)